MSLNDMMYKPIALNIKSSKKLDDASESVACVTLGCAKNQVDSEIFLGSVLNAGYKVVTELSDADYIIVNSCGFLGDAMKESIDAVLEATDYKKNGKLKKLILAGCMVSRYGIEKMQELFPEVDAFLSTDDILRLPEVLSGNTISDSPKGFLYDDTMPRVISSGKHTAYVKIADGCTRPCAFCMIPKIKGPTRSRRSDSIIREIQMLGEQGVKEVNLIGQDLTAYGIDNHEIPLAQLLRKIDACKAVPWVRLLYAYPIGATEELLNTIVELPSVCNYFDVPLQHASETVLQRMRRPVGQYAPRRLVEWIKTKFPQIHLRTTFIVGYPGETEEEFAELEKFVSEGYFDCVGVFAFSQEEGAPASDLPDQLPENIKENRRERLMLLQQKVLEKRLKSLIGESFEVLIDGYHEETDLLLVGRTRFQAPEVDGSVIINDSDIDMEQLKAGSLVRVEITECAGYDLIAKVTALLD